MERENSNIALIAIFVSRFEAIQIASMLRGYGIHAFIDGEAHAATEYISMAFGGHRLTVFRDDYECASQILRQAGVLDGEFMPRGPSKALLILVAGIASLYTATLVIVSAPLAYILAAPLMAYTIPVEPKGRADYFLAETEG